MARAPLLEAPRLEAEGAGPEKARRPVVIRGAVYRVRHTGAELPDAPATHVKVGALVEPKPEEEMKAVLAELGGDSTRAELFLPMAQFTLFPDKRMSTIAMCEVSEALEQVFASVFTSASVPDWYSITTVKAADNRLHIIARVDLDDVRVLEALLNEKAQALLSDPATSGRLFF